MKWGVWLQTCETVHPPWYAECVQEGREDSLWWCAQVSCLTPGFDRTMSGERWVTPPPAAAGWVPPPSCLPSLWGSRPGLLQTARTGAPVGRCGTAAPRTESSHCWSLDVWNWKCNTFDCFIYLLIYLFYLWLIAVGHYLKDSPLQILHVGNAKSVGREQVVGCRLFRIKRLQRNGSRESRASGRV